MTDQREKPFSSLHETCLYLNAEGYKVSKSKIYRDADEGKITREADGTVTAEAAREYAKTHLVRSDAVHTKEELKNLQATKLKKAIRNQDIDYARKKFDLEKEQGKYIPRDDFNAEMAARAAVLDSGFRHLFNVKTREWIKLVEGNPDRQADLLAQLNQDLDEQLTKYATTQVFQVLFEEKDED
jgi:hypothetical protein